MNPAIACTLPLLAFLSQVSCQAATPALLIAPVVLNDDGGWCWFQDERALALGDRIVFGSVAAGRHDPERRGNVECVSWSPVSGELSRVTLHERLELDDHNAPALLQLDNCSLLAVYAKHGTDHLVRWRRQVDPRDVSNWTPEKTLSIGEDQRMGVTYSNLHRGQAPGEVLNFFRSIDWDPSLIISRDNGDSWEYVGRVLGGPGRPYLKYTSDGRGLVHLIATEQHPRDYDNSLYHGVVRNREVLDSQGQVLGQVGTEPPTPEELTCVFRGSPGAVAWPIDLELDAAGHPGVLFSVQVDGEGIPHKQGGLDHRLHHARFDGQVWKSEQVGHLGRRLYAGEDDYTGLAAIDPVNPNVLYLSTDADPDSGAPLISAADGQRHRELFRAERCGEGETWTFLALTENSTRDNLRPIVPRGEPRALLWLRGKLSTYTNYSLEVVGSIL